MLDTRDETMFENGFVSQFYIMLPSFDLWRAEVDRVFMRYTGRSSFDLPIPDRTWRSWWTAGTWPAQCVGELLAAFVEELDRRLA